MKEITEKAEPKSRLDENETKVVTSVIDSWYSQFGPEGLFEIADLMKSIAMKNMEKALQEL